MTKTDVFNFYAKGRDFRGANAAVARALGKTTAAICRWPEQLPPVVQYEIEVRSGYVLQSEFTKQRLAGEI